MKVSQLRIFIAMAGLLIAAVSTAQEPPLMPCDPAIRSCILPNGLSCYVAENVSCKGVADFVLVNKDYTGADIVVKNENVIVSKETTLDSTLLGLMRRVEADAVPADCAIIVCGDVNAGLLLTKLKYMSLMVDATTPSAFPESYWEGDQTLRMTMTEDTLSGLASVHCEWQAPMTSRDRMNTTQAAIYEKTTWELGGVACRWIRRSLRKQDIPYADVSFSRDVSEDGFSYETFSFDVTVAPEDLEKVRKTVASVLASLDKGQFGMNDLLLADKDYVALLEGSAHKAVMGNDEYVRICRAAFLYNRPLSTDRERLDFFESKSVSESLRKNIFSSIVTALLDQNESPDSSVVSASGVMLSDTLGFPGQSVKTKVRSSRRDTFSGGNVWTFANGFKVIYHRMPSTDKKLYYSLSMNGGYGNVEDLEAGEGAYMSDYLDVCWIAGLKSADFKDVLRLAGMTADMRVRVFNTVISGQVEDRNAPLMMKAILALVNESRPDASEVDYFSRCERLRMSLIREKDVRAVIDSLMCPEQVHTPFKSQGSLGDRTFEKAETLFSSLTSRMNDGLLVIVGDMDEDELKKSLQMYVGDLRVRNVVSRRPNLLCHPVSGWSSYSVEGDEPSAVVAVSTPLVMTTTNHFAGEMAAMIFERRVKDALGTKDLSVKMSFGRTLYPDERLNIMVQLTGDFSQEDVAQLRRILSDCRHDVTKEELDFYKQNLKAACTLQVTKPEYWLRAIPLRYLEGKDFTSGFASKIDAVSLEVIKQVFEALSEGAGIEYVTTKK